MSRIAALDKYIRNYERTFLSHGLHRASTRQQRNRYFEMKREKFRLNRAAKRIQTMFRTAKAKKSSTQLMSHHPNFRRLHEKNQRKIMSLAFKL
jgi:hypothetical protein